ncbi:hypothetical protein DM860_014769 [Cuscuta australis]|uniref:Uncharacterized protein n=1 Tax=Cuscuta australis TaxID=267555 RepID=A0A328D4S9_9ASTE|nr:hypothetical protein DM860_014769 [Cuscuta australis]
MPLLKARADSVDLPEVPQQAGGWRAECGCYTMRFIWLIIFLYSVFDTITRCVSIYCTIHESQIGRDSLVLGRFCSICRNYSASVLVCSVLVFAL